nr:MAG TPA: hypothetical protein [Bacteriophage sp.]
MPKEVLRSIGLILAKARNPRSVEAKVPLC